MGTSVQIQCGDGKKVPRYPSNYHKSKWQWKKEKKSNKKWYKNWDPERDCQQGAN